MFLKAFLKSKLLSFPKAEMYDPSMCYENTSITSFTMGECHTIPLRGESQLNVIAKIPWTDPGLGKPNACLISFFVFCLTCRQTHTATSDSSSKSKCTAN